MTNSAAIIEMDGGNKSITIIDIVNEEWTGCSSRGEMQSNGF